MPSPTTSCPKCGSAISDGSRFCGHCGHVLSVAPAPPTDNELTRRTPRTILEGSELGVSTLPEETKKTQLGNAHDFTKTAADTSSVENLLASLDEWSAPPSEPKVPAAAPTPPPVSEGRAPMFGRTMIGGSVTAAEVMREAASQRQQLEDTTNKTMIGVATVDQPAFAMTPAPAPQPPLQPEAARPQPAKPTQIGDAPFGMATQLGQPVLQQPAFGPPPGGKPTQLGSAPLESPSQVPEDPQAYRPAFKTMLGVALPGIAPVRDSERSLKIAQEQTLQGGVGSPPASRPRIPPTAPMAATPQPPPSRPVPMPAPAPTPRQPPPPILPAPAPLVEEPLPQAPRVVQTAKPGGISAVAVIGIVAALVAVAGAGAAVYVLRSGPALTAQARLDESGQESLAIHCASCADGTKVSLGASSTTVAKGDAVLPLPAPLSIGDNPLEITVDRPGVGRDEKVKIHVPIAYRVKADLTTLASMPPVVTVRVEAEPGTDVTVDAKPVTLDASGKGSYALDVSADAVGPSDEQKTIDKKIPFVVKRKGATAPEPGELVVRAGIVPLHVDAPGVELVTDRATANVVGQTKPGGAITVDGQTVALDASGHYQIRAELPAMGDKTLTIVANAPSLAPRTVKAKVTRVASLSDAANALDGQNPLAFEAYAADPASKVGELVAINGEIQEIRVQQGHTLMVVEEKKTCANSSCLVRLAHGEEVSAKRGDAIRAYGKVTGAVPFQSKQIPAVSGVLVITAPPAKGKR